MVSHFFIQISSRVFTIFELLILLLNIIIFFNVSKIISQYRKVPDPQSASEQTDEPGKDKGLKSKKRGPRFADKEPPEVAHFYTELLNDVIIQVNSAVKTFKKDGHYYYWHGIKHNLPLKLRVLAKRAEYILDRVAATPDKRRPDLSGPEHLVYDKATLAAIDVLLKEAEQKEREKAGVLTSETEKSTKDTKTPPVANVDLLSKYPVNAPLPQFRRYPAHVFEYDLVKDDIEQFSPEERR